MKFSIIIPCYNTGLYLEKCLKSILRQTYENWEVILVDDGSTDNTAEIIKSYVRKDNRIKAFYQKNRGASAARNSGIVKVSGDYIIFCDSDDRYYNKMALEHIAAATDGGIIDIVTFQYIKLIGRKTVYGDNNLQYLCEDRIYTSDEFFQEVLGKKEQYEWYPWLYAFKTELLIENNIKFNSDTYAFTDVEIIYQIILKARTVTILKEALYEYRVGREGQLTSVSKRLLRNMLKVSSANIKKVNYLSIATNTQILLNGNFSHIYYIVLILVYYLPKNDQKEIFNLLNENRNIMKYTLDRRDLIIRIMVRVFGLHITARLLYIRSKLRKRKNR